MKKFIINFTAGSANLTWYEIEAEDLDAAHEEAALLFDDVVSSWVGWDIEELENDDEDS